MSRRADRKTQTEERILDAALQVFAHAGYAAATMDGIAEAAGLSKPTLYNYFASKDLLFRAMLHQPRDEMTLAIDTEADGDHVRQLWRFAWVYAETVMRPELLSLARLIIGEAQRFPDVGRAYQASGPDRVLERLSAFMARQGACGHLRIDDPELAAEDFWGLILSAPRNRALHVPDAAPDHEALARFVHNGLRVFLRAYSCNVAQDLTRLDQVIAKG